ncbi:OmpH family outer membrane protein [uncultured Sneathiella sp.]|uniref:OmpH family outer membrane protein n=1 Tax=uncultured Sneathiella sp. TaxID=879315 RepID=UPI0030EF126A|tara:strand:- start:117259 stop:117753 length:495 start_codon:yes stop_codon:yes gene_type:complete
MNNYKYIIVIVIFISNFITATSFANGVALIDYDRILRSVGIVAEYQKAVETLKADILAEYNGLDDQRTQSVNDQLTQQSRDALVKEISNKEADLVKEWLSGLTEINLKYDNEFLALDEKINDAITKIMTSQNLTVIQEGATSTTDEKNTTDITAQIIDSINGGK